MQMPWEISERAVDSVAPSREYGPVAITNHAIMRWRQRIEDVSEAEAVKGILMALQTAKPKHLEKKRIRKRTFYIPTARAVFVGSNRRIVTVLVPGQSPYAFEAC